MENQTTVAQSNKEHRRWHWHCCVLPIVGTILWVASILFAVAAWMSVVRNDLVWGYGAQWWIWNALMFGILALFGKGRCGCRSCGMSGHCC